MCKDKGSLFKRALALFMGIALVAGLVPPLALAEAEGGDTVTLSDAVKIDSSNKSTYDGKVVTGTIPGYRYINLSGRLKDFEGAIVIDGIELSLTIEGLSVDHSGQYSPYSCISLVNGAILHLTVRGTNTLKGGYGGAGISVPEGCTLEITASSDGTLDVIGGDNYGGGAGIGDVSDGTNPNNLYHNTPRSMGTVVINGGTVNATGGTHHSYGRDIQGAAGIGSSNESKRTGTITITGGTVNATGGLGAAGIGGGFNGTVESITISGGVVTATGEGAIGTGYNSYVNGYETITVPDISINGGTVTANGNIGFGGASDPSLTVGGSVTVSGDATVTCKGTVLAASVDWELPTVYFDANGGAGTMEDEVVQPGDSYVLPECGFDAPEGKYFQAWQVETAGTTGQLDPGDTITVVFANTLVKPIWGELPAVHFEANGGTGAMEDAFVQSGDSYVLPACGFGAPEGKYFQAWQIEKAGTTSQLYPGDTITVDADVVVRPVWGEWPTGEEWHLVHFDANGGTGAMEDAVVHLSSIYELPDCGFGAPEGKCFVTWQVETAGTTSQRDPGSRIYVYANTLVKPVWGEYCTIHFDADGGTGSMEDVVVYQGDSYVLPACGFGAPEGEYFKAWQVETAGTTGQLDPGDTITVDADAVVRPVWGALCTIHFDADGGTGAMEDVVVHQGDSYVLPACGFGAPEGEYFKAWQVETAGTTGQLDPGDTITVDADAVVRPVWGALCTIHFDANGGTGAMEDAVVHLSSIYELPDCGFGAPEGKYFVAWQVQRAGLTFRFDPGSKIIVYMNTLVKPVWGDAQSASWGDTPSHSTPAADWSGSGIVAPGGKGFRAWPVKRCGMTLWASPWDYMPGGRYVSVRPIWAFLGLMLGIRR